MLKDRKAWGKAWWWSCMELIIVIIAVLLLLLIFFKLSSCYVAVYLLGHLRCMIIIMNTIITNTILQMD